MCGLPLTPSDRRYVTRPFTLVIPAGTPRNEDLANFLFPGEQETILTPRMEDGRLHFDFFAPVGGWWIEKADLVAMANEYRVGGELPPVTMHLASPGGDPFEAAKVAAYMRSFPDTEVIVEGECASAAVAIMLSADRRLADPGAVFMVHPCAMLLAYGTSDDLRSAADACDTITEASVQLYASRTGQDTDTIRPLVRATTWLTATQARDLGFIHSAGESDDEPDDEPGDGDTRPPVAIQRAHQLIDKGIVV